MVRILGIDTPETRRLEHNLPFDQPFGKEANAFAKGAFAAATDLELLRCPTLDPYGRTLAYLFINGRNFSIMVIKARYSTETVSHYGDNGLPAEAAEVKAAAKDIGPLPFEPPHVYRASDARPDDLDEAKGSISSQLSDRSEGNRDGNCSLRGAHVRLVPPDRTLHLENALVWLNVRPRRSHGDDQEAQPGRQRDARKRSSSNIGPRPAATATSSGRSSTKRAGISALSVCTRLTGETVGPLAVS